ncbi:hypothetical protein BH23GEM10_BH23GEM10_08370 [soil metagenome]
MGRKLRIQLPGAPFHITARLHAGERLFEGIEARIVELILRTAAEEGIDVVAYAVMPNHLHLMVVHGARPLGKLMQPLLRRVALLVQRRHDRVGRVFERPYRARACLDPGYARNAITYIHLNPVRAGLCPDPTAYKWTSHRAYCTDVAGGSVSPASVASFLRLFADEPDASLATCRASYQQFVVWRAALDASNSGAPDELRSRPDTWGGDVTWPEQHGIPTRQSHSSCSDPPMAAGRPDLEDIARSVLRAEAPGLPVDCLRHNGKTRRHVALRREVILRCLAAGYANHQIARYLRVADTTVSKVRMAEVRARMAGSVK